MRKLYLFLFFCLSVASTVYGQFSNDECANAVILENVSNFCSGPEGFSTELSTPSPDASPFCFPSPTGINEDNDVWFVFTAEATTLVISVTGNTAGTSFGTLEDPQVALYAGSCRNLTEVQCISDAFNRNTIQTFAGPLTIGANYYLRVSARNRNKGTFQLCVNNYNEVPKPSGDCSTAVVLCDKSPITIPFVNGVGLNANEVNGSSCDNASGCRFVEQSSTWYKWTCKDPGTLGFVLTPLNPDDDLDFILFELPNSLDDCNNKRELRCMFSGENVGSPMSEWQACTGPTGIRKGETSTGESCGCSPGDNNFVSEIEMEAGKSYALVINNFTESGSGFTLEFTGTGTFLGPNADIELSDVTVCIGDPVTLRDASTFVGRLEGWEWNFGQDASISDSDSQGPHSVSYNRPGTKSILLTVESETGCLVSVVKKITVACCPGHFDVNGVVADLKCPDAQDGAIDLSVSNPYGPYQFSWNNGQEVEDINNLDAGAYEVTIVDQVTCETTLSFNVNSPPPLEVDTAIVMPTCNGGTDGAVTLTLSGGTPGYEFNWQGAGYTAVNSISNIPIGDYAVTIRDANACETPLLIPVRELELILDPSVDAVTPPTCTGFSNGQIVVNINNGNGPYLYDWQNGNGLVDENSLVNVSAGVYQVNVQDVNLCKGSFTFNMEDHPPLELQFDIMDVSCNGLRDGSVTAIPSGGVGNYQYQWAVGSTSQGLENLPTGNYPIIVTDGNGCIIEDIPFVPEPLPVFVQVGGVTNVVCFGDATGLVTLLGSGGVMPYSFSVDGVTFQSSNSFPNLPADDYQLLIRDAEGCLDTTETVVRQPPELTVDAGPDQVIDLGFSTNIEAQASEFPVAYQWSPEESLDCMDCPFTEAMPVRTTTYMVTVINEDNCTATDEMTVEVVANRPIYIPNAISPNGDDRNNFFTLFSGPAGRAIKKLQIFDRWGELVFETQDIPLNDERMGWDGTFRGQPVNPGVYVYVAEVTFIDDVTLTYSGDVAILR